MKFLKRLRLIVPLIILIGGVCYSIYLLFLSLNHTDMIKITSEDETIYLDKGSYITYYQTSSSQNIDDIQSYLFNFVVEINNEDNQTIKYFNTFNQFQLNDGEYISYYLFEITNKGEYQFTHTPPNEDDFVMLIVPEGDSILGVVLTFISSIFLSFVTWLLFHVIILSIYGLKKQIKKIGKK